MKIRVADYIVRRLSEYGVDAVFLLNGGGMMHLVDAVGRCEKITYVCSHHEQASAMAADGYARLSGKLGVCFATSGPGATNTLTGVVGAWQDSSPVLFLTGQSKTSQTIGFSGIDNLRQFGTFEVDIVPILKTVTKYSYMVVAPESIRFHLEKAIFLATTGRPGPVVLDLPLDVQGALVDPEIMVGYSPDLAPAQEIGDAIDRVVSLLADAKRPLFLVGAGVRAANAVSELHRLIEVLKVPVVTTQLGKDAVYYGHPMFVGHPGPKGDRPGNFAVQTADLIISLGCSLHSQTTGWESDLFAPDAVKVQVDLDPAVLAREKVNVDVKIEVGVERFIEEMLARKCRYSTPARWLDICRSWKERYAVKRENHDRSTSAVNFYDFIEVLSQVLPSDCCIVSDAGSAFYVTGQALRIKQNQRFISSGSLGAMGYALPAANGASFVDDTMVVCVTGDGSLMTNVHDLATMREYKKNIKLFVVNNNGYVSMRNTQRDFFEGLYVGADASSGVFIPSIEALAKTFEIPYFSCSEEAELECVIKEALEVEGPVLCEIFAISNQKIMPSVSSKRLPDGSMRSTPIHDMVPNLPDEVLRQEVHDAKSVDSK